MLRVTVPVQSRFPRGAALAATSLCAATVLAGAITVAALLWPAAIPATVTAPPAAVYLALQDGNVERVDVRTGARESIASQHFGHFYADLATQVALDAQAGRLWYSDTHVAVKSIDPATLEYGDTLAGFADVALVGCATVSDGRPIAIDEQRRRIVVPVGTGGLLVYDVDTLRLDAAVSASHLEAEPGMLPAIAIDARTGALWYGAADGSLVEIDGERFRATGRRIAYGTDAHAVRSLSAVNGTLAVLNGRGELRAYDLDRLTEVTSLPAVATSSKVVSVALSR